MKTKTTLSILFAILNVIFLSSSVSAGWGWLRPKPVRDSYIEKQDRSPAKTVNTIFHNIHGRSVQIRILFWRNGSRVRRSFLMLPSKKKMYYSLGKFKDSKVIRLETRSRLNSNNRWSKWRTETWRVYSGTINRKHVY